MGFRGIFAIPPTPFFPDGSLDEASLRSCITFCLQAGVHGLVYPVNASEFDLLTDEERRYTMEIVAKEVDGRIPFIAGVAAPSVQGAIRLAEQAQVAGADGLIAMPPYVHKPTTPDDVCRFYAAIDQVAEVPIFIQNYIGPVGTPLSAGTMARLVNGLAHVQYIKEETDQSNHIITEVRQLAGDNLKGIMGGKAGRVLLQEYERGVCGTMPACEIADLHVPLWHLLEKGEKQAARAYFQQLLPLLNFEATVGVGPVVYKEVLRRRGVIAHSTSRRPNLQGFDEFDSRELDKLLAELGSLLSVAPVA